MPTQNATKFIVFAISDTLTAVGMGTFQATSHNVRKEASNIQIKDARGATMSDVTFDPKLSGSLTVTPFSVDNEAGAVTQANTNLEPGDQVVLANADTGAMNGKFILRSWGIDTGNESALSKTFEIERFTGASPLPSQS